MNISEQIKKLFALGEDKSATAAEARNAINKAHELIAKYQIEDLANAKVQRCETILKHPVHMGRNAGLLASFIGKGANISVGYSWNISSETTLVGYAHAEVWKEFIELVNEVIEIGTALLKVDRKAAPAGQPYHIYARQWWKGFCVEYADVDTTDEDTYLLSLQHLEENEKTQTAKAPKEPKAPKDKETVAKGKEAGKKTKGGKKKKLAEPEATAPADEPAQLDERGVEVVPVETGPGPEPETEVPVAETVTEPSDDPESEFKD